MKNTSSSLKTSRYLIGEAKLKFKTSKRNSKNLMKGSKKFRMKLLRSRNPLNLTTTNLLGIT